MTKKDILDLAIKILGLYLLFVALRQIEIVMFSVTSLFQSGSFRFSSIVIIAPFIVYFYMAIFLIRKSDLILQKLNLHDDHDIAKINITKDEFQESVYSIIGIVLIATALIKVPQQVTRYANYGVFGGKFAVYKYGDILIQIIIGLYLVLGSKRLVGLINKFKR